MSEKRKIFYLVFILLLSVIAVKGILSENPQKTQSNLKVKKIHPPKPEPIAPMGNGKQMNNTLRSLSKSQDYSASRVSSYQPEGGPRDNFWIPTDGSEVTLAQLKGPGAITHIWTTHRGDGHDLMIRMYWEGSKHPSVEAPIGDFFGVSMGINAPINSFPSQVSSEGRSRNCWWYMPFNQSARVTVSATHSSRNLDRETVALYFYIDYQVYDRPIEDIHYFHARFLETDPTTRGKPVPLVKIEGNGHFVGLVMGHRSRTPGWFGEGDDIITVDGKLSFWGTGTEDYFCDAWGFREFTYPFYGAPVFEGREIGSRLSVYRFHIRDPIPFRKSFTFEIEHYPWISPWPNTGRGYYSSVGFWYQKKVHKPWPRLEEIIANSTWDPNKGRWHIQGALEAEDLGILDFETYKEKVSAPQKQHVMPNFSGDHILVFDSGVKGKISLLVPVKEAQKYKPVIYFVRAPDYGKVQLSINGQPLGKIVDTYLKTDNLTRPIWPPKRFVFPEVSLNEGMNIFTFVVDSKNPESEGYKIGIDCVVLEKEEI